MKDQGEKRRRGLRDKLAPKATQLKEKGFEEIEALTTKINEIRPIMESLGYRVMGAKISVTIPPSVSIGVAGLSQAQDTEAHEKAIEAHRDDKMIVGIIKGLDKVSALRARLPIEGFHADLAEVLLGVPPSVTLMFKRR